MQKIDEEFALTNNLLRHLFPEPLAERRPMQSAAMHLRKVPLAALHHQQIQLLREWRMVKDLDGTNDSTNKLLSDLFLSVNAIAGGIRNTG
jgi:phosphoenolpyruvate carboxylase